MSNLKKKVRILTEHNSDGTHNDVAQASLNLTVEHGSDGVHNESALTTLLQHSLVWEKTISGAAVTSVTTDGEVTLDGNAHGGYEFEYIIVNSAGISITVSMFYNNNQTSSDYQRTALYIGPAITSGTANNALIDADGFPNGAALWGTGDIIISPLGIISARLRHFRSDNYGMFYFHRKIATEGNLTRLDIVSSAASGIGINSRFRLWRRI